MSRFAHLRQRLAAILERLNAGDSETALRRWMHHGEAPHSPAQLRLVLEWEAFVIAARANTNGIDLEAGDEVMALSTPDVEPAVRQLLTGH